MRTGMKWWDEQNIEWYERAAFHSSFHRNLAEHIAAYLDKEKPITELGCGLGYISAYLKEDGYDITASDISDEAIARAAERTGLAIFSVLDADSTLPYSPQLLMVFFGQIHRKEKLEHFIRGRELIISVHSWHSSHGFQERKNNIEELRTILSDEGYPYKEEVLELDFNQPLLSEEDADRFIEATYPEEHKDRISSLLRSGIEYPLVLPNRKRLSIFAIHNKETI